jgi:hypothetical protein
LRLEQKKSHFAAANNKQKRRRRDRRQNTKARFGCCWKWAERMMMMKMANQCGVVVIVLWRAAEIACTLRALILSTRALPQFGLISKSRDTPRMRPHREN